MTSTETEIENPPLLAFHGDPAIKQKYLDRVRMHRAADEIVSGQYWERGKGCAVGCTLHGSRHSDYEVELGMPRVLARLEDGIFERTFHVDTIAAKAWPEEFLTAPKVGADLSMVWPVFAEDPPPEQAPDAGRRVIRPIS